mmetsp:Transcript_56588/g.156604  ORF Transcript_56588/g.156604 Transcript_56588/m.156604 type:complete len:105 (-) Transcript_56588:955-1269(-)
MPPKKKGKGKGKKGGDDGAEEGGKLSPRSEREQFRFECQSLQMQLGKPRNCLCLPRGPLQASPMQHTITSLPAHFSQPSARRMLPGLWPQRGSSREKWRRSTSR